MRTPRLLTSGTELVRMAAALRQGGTFQGSPRLWTAENPLRHDVSRLLQKVRTAPQAAVGDLPMLLIGIVTGFCMWPAHQSTGCRIMCLRLTVTKAAT